MRPVTPHKKRPHPARRARVIVGALSVGAAVGITGGLAMAATTTTAVATTVSTTTVDTTALPAVPATPVYSSRSANTTSGGS